MRWLARFAVVAGIAMIALPPILWQQRAEVATVGDVASIEAAASAPPEVAKSTSGAAEVVTSAAAVPQASSANPTPDGGQPEITRGIAPLLQATAAQPVGLRIDAIGLDAPVSGYGVDRRTGQMDVPSNVSEVAWYEFGAIPGAAGSAVLAAHVDLASQGPGVFFHLRDLIPGDRIYVEYDDGTEQEFAVSARTVYEKDELPLDVVFAKDGPPRLTLVTCGGGFNTTAQAYDSNVVVYAAPVQGETGANDPVENPQRRG